VPTNSIFIGFIVLSPGNDENANAYYIAAAMRVSVCAASVVVVRSCRMEWVTADI